MTRLYFDYNATTPMAACVTQKMSEHVLEFGNPNSIHAHGRRARQIIELGRRSVAENLSCTVDEVVYLSGATEANNLALHSAWEHRRAGANEIILSSVEHESVLQVAKLFEKQGAILKYIPVEVNGQLNLDFVEKNLSEKTAFITLMYANNETGFVFPVKKISLMARSVGVLLHVDAACGLGKLPIDFRDVGADYMSASAHKFYGPKGIGCLIVRKGAPVSPQIVGGSQERGVRAGTENVIGIVGMAEALSFSMLNIKEEMLRLMQLRNRLKRGLDDVISGIDFIESSQFQMAGTLSCLVPEVRGQTFLAALDLAGVSASLGSACSSGAIDVSRVILALGINPERAKGVLRLSFGRYTTEGEIDQLVGLMGVVHRKCIENYAN